MITRHEYNALKSFKDSKDGLTYKEYGDFREKGHLELSFQHFDTNGYIMPNLDVWKKRQAYILSKKGINAVEFYEKWINYPHICKQAKKHVGTKYVIVEHRSGCFCTDVYHMSYTSNIGFSHDISDATLYQTRKKAEEALAEAIKDTPTKYQNPNDYEFSVEEVKLSVSVELPKTFVCKDCGKVHPISEYYVSTYCPNSWNTGVCHNCRAARERKEREAMYGRNQRGVFDYDSFD